MKSFVLTELDGFPFSQTNLDWLQSAYTEAITGILSIAPGSKLKLSGCGVTGSGPYLIADGAVVIDGIFMPLVGGSVADPATASFKVVELTTSLSFNDGSLRPVKKEKKCVLDPTGTILFADLTPFLLSAASAIENDWVQVTNDTTSAISYKIDRIARVCYVRGWCKHFTDYQTSLNLPQMKQVASGLPALSGSGVWNFHTTIPTHLVDQVTATDTGGLYTGEVGQLTSGNVSILSRHISLSGTALTNLKHNINFSYPI
ncbi:hypothetical protein D3C72_535420 [compost metagenome]